MSRDRRMYREVWKQIPREVRFLTLAEQHVWVEGIATCVRARPQDGRTVAQVVGAEIDRWMANPLHRAILNADGAKNPNQHSFVQVLASPERLAHELKTRREYAAGAVLRSLHA